VDLREYFEEMVMKTHFNF